MPLRAACVALCLAVTMAAPAPFRFASYYANDMVLQRAPESAVVWGFAPVNGATVSITIDTKQYKTLVSNGQWRVELDPVEGGTEPTTIIAESTGQPSITLTGVLFGDVWVCGGQSNMQFSVSQAFNATAEIAAAANYPNIRLFTAALMQSPTPVVDLLGVEQQWSIASPASVGHGNWSYFSATCWFFARNTYDREQIPLGMVASNWGGTPVEAWSSPDALSKCPATTVTRSESKRQESDITLGGPGTNSVLWNAMIVPLTNMTIKGAIWYQGEADSQPGVAPLYACRFPAMIDDWRATWAAASGSHPVFPFGFVQLSDWEDSSNDTTINYAPIVRLGQTANYSYVPNPRQPNVFMAVAIDLGDPKSPFGDVHSRYKQPVGERLSLAGAAIAYNHTDLYWTGPIAESAAIAPLPLPQGQVAVNVTFRNTGSAGIRVNQKSLDGFAIETGGVWAVGTVVSSSSDTVTIVANGTAAPTGVRYEFMQAPCHPDLGPYMCTVYASAEGLPAVPFVKAL